MAKPPYHPETAQIDLSAVLDALSDPLRRAIVLHLAEIGEDRCSGLDHLAGKTNLTYHYARLREAGVTRTRLEGPYRFLSLRREDLARRFPGLLDTVIACARREAAEGKLAPLPHEA